MSACSQNMSREYDPIYGGFAYAGTDGGGGASRGRQEGQRKKRAMIYFANEKTEEVLSFREPKEIPGQEHRGRSKLFDFLSDGENGWIKLDSQQEYHDLLAKKGFQPVVWGKVLAEFNKRDDLAPGQDQLPLKT